MANIKIIEKQITRAEATEIGKEFYEEIVKGVVDVEKEILALGGEYHMDANMILIENGSLQNSLWGFNIYPVRSGNDWIEYTSLINIRPSSGNRNMTVENEETRRAMKDIIEKLIV